ncbi:Type 1 glutamine amidotransferase-like domain-containing protein [Frankia sp. AgB1.9]|nr:Type 1 glutamine amidotransferase-like domain-containing protein [Frankia sp. AgW1.1]MBL7547666.1 Type 1 glutamine amidotransferase-like domain-containing protein [Frankia sp. AgB1.9]
MSRWKHGRVDVTLVGGGRDTAAAPTLFGPFVAAAGPGAVIACVLVDEGDDRPTPPWTRAYRRARRLDPFDRWSRLLTSAGPCRPVLIQIPSGGRLDVAALDGATGLFVAGGLTPDYATALASVRADVHAWLARTGAPYAGYSAGAAVAADRAVIGGWRSDGLPICDEEAGESLDEVTVTDGLGLVPALVDIHCAQWGTLPRLLVAARAEAAAGRPAEGWGIDEDTAIHLTDDAVTVLGRGQVHRLVPGPDELTVEQFAATDRLPDPRAPQPQPEPAD